MPHISNARVLIMATNRFEECELFGPREILLAKGAKVALASLDRADIMATIHDEPGRTITPDLTIAEARVDD
jgi:protease I